jgi:hypothetical protein
MSNSQDVALWGLTEGDNCPALATIKNALASHAPPPLPPLPEGVVWDPSNNGTVNFVNADDPAKRTHPYMWDTAKDSAAKGSLQYATIAYNCATYARELDWGWAPIVWSSVVPVLDMMTGLPTYKPGPMLSPFGSIIHPKYATYEQALAFVNGK